LLNLAKAHRTQKWLCCQQGQLLSLYDMMLVQYCRINATYISAGSQQVITLRLLQTSYAGDISALHAATSSNSIIHPVPDADIESASVRATMHPESHADPLHAAR
jgi:hypothetical protein